MYKARLLMTKKKLRKTIRSDFFKPRLRQKTRLSNALEKTKKGRIFRLRLRAISLT